MSSDEEDENDSSVMGTAAEDNAEAKGNFGRDGR
jgi:hypothetical protein